MRYFKVRFIGSSSTIPHIWDLLDLDVFDAFQIPYSALERDHEVAITEAHRKGAGVIIRGGVARGGPRPDRPQFKNVWEAWGAANIGQLLEAGQSPVEFVLRYTLGQPGLSTIIVGTASAGHLQDNVAQALRGPLPADVYQEARQRLDAAGGDRCGRPGAGRARRRNDHSATGWRPPSTCWFCGRGRP